MRRSVMVGWATGALLLVLPLLAWGGNLGYDRADLGLAHASSPNGSLNGGLLGGSVSISDYFALQGNFTYLSTSGFNIGTLTAVGAGHFQVLPDTDLVGTLGVIHPNSNTSTPTGTISVGKSAVIYGVGVRTAPISQIEIDLGYSRYRTDYWTPGVQQNVGISTAVLFYQFGDGLAVFANGSHTSTGAGNYNQLLLGVRFIF